MTALPPLRVLHVRDGFIVANVGLLRSETAPAHFHEAATSNIEVEK